MKNRNIIVIVILAIVLIGGMYFFDNKENKDGQIKEEPSVVTETPGNAEAPTTSNYPNMAVAGKIAPDFTLKNLSGEDVTLSDYKGKIVIINFWATWCVWCDAEMPDIQKIQEENDDVVVLAVDVKEDIKDVKAYIEKGGYDFEVLLDSTGEISKVYLVNVFPNSIFIDKEGVVLGKIEGAMNYARMDEILESIRAEE